MLLILMLVATIRGLLRGTIAQVFAFLGIGLGLVGSGVTAAWIGRHWAGASPALLFGALRWLVALLTGLAIASLFHWWGETLGKAVHGGPLGPLDRVLGAAIGLAIGCTLAVAVLVIGLLTPGLSGVRAAAGRGEVSRPLLSAGVRFTAGGVTHVPGVHWLHETFVKAARRLPPRSAARGGAH